MIFGRLDRRIDIERPVVTIDTFGAESTTWEVFARVWAEAQPLRTAERYQSAQIREAKAYTFRIRYLSGLETTMRIRYRNELYRITGIAEMGRRVGQEISAEYLEGHGASLS